MIGFDTNVLVRLIVADDPSQVQQAQRFVERHCSRENPGFIGAVVLAEAVWVLESTYRMDRSDIAYAVEELLATSEFHIQDGNAVRSVLEDFRKTSVGFTDLLIAYLNRAQGCDTTATFDRRAARLDGFTLVR